MNLFLVNPNMLKPRIPPIGILYVAGYLEKHGYTPHVIDLSTMESEDDVGDYLPKSTTPDAIGFSIRNIDSVLMLRPAFFLQDIAKIVDAMRARYPGVPIVLGGAGFSIEPLEITKFLGADYGVIGEGEVTMLELLKRLEQKRSCQDLSGLVYKTDSGYRLNPPQMQSSVALGTLPYQAIDLIDYRKYFDMGGMASIQTKRGCALACDYCTYPIIEGKRYRFIPPERIVDELEFFASKGYDYVHFCDSVFNVPRAHAIRVCKEIVKRKMSIKWLAYMSPYKFDDELAELLLEAGNDGVEFGNDTCSQKMLVELGKNFKKEEIHEAAAVCKRHGIDFAVNIIFGGPGETMDTVSETMDALDEISPTAALILQGLRVYRGTPLYMKLLNQGVISTDQLLLEPHFYRSEQLPSNFTDIVHQYAVSRPFAFCESNIPADPSAAADSPHRESYLREPYWRLLRHTRDLMETNGASPPDSDHRGPAQARGSDALHPFTSVGLSELPGHRLQNQPRHPG